MLDEINRRRCRYGSRGSVLLIALAMFSPINALAQNPPRPPAPNAMPAIPAKDREAILEFLKKTIEVQKAEQHRLETLSTTHGVSGYSSVTTYEAIAIDKGIAAARQHLRKAETVQAEFYDIETTRWSGMEAIITSSKVSPRHKYMLTQAFEKGWLRFTQSKSAIQKAETNYRTAIMDMLDLLQRHVSDISVSKSGRLAFKNQGAQLQYESLHRRISVVADEWLNRENLSTIDDGVNHILKCALTGHSDTTRPDIRYCAFESRISDPLEQAKQGLIRLQEIDISLQDMVTPEKVTNRAMLDETRRSVISTLSTQESIIRSTRRQLSKLKITRLDTDLSGSTQPTADADLALLDKLIVPTTDLLDVRQESARLLQSMLDFFQDNLGTVKLENGEYKFDNRNQEIEFLALAEQLDQLESRALLTKQELGQILNRMRK
jgi:hypothetical protein